MRAPNSTGVPFSTKATKRSCGKALSPRLAPGDPKAVRFASVSATSRPEPSKLTSRQARYHAPLLARVAIGPTTCPYNRRNGASPRRVRACEMPLLPAHLDRFGAPQPAQPLQQAAQDLAGAAAHGERQGDRVVDHDLRRQVALALARLAGLGQDLANPVRRERPGDHAEADAVAQTDAGRQAGRSAGHHRRSLNAGPPDYACRTSN